MFNLSGNLRHCFQQEEDFRTTETFNDDPTWTYGTAKPDVFSSHTAELKGNNDLLTLTKVLQHLKSLFVVAFQSPFTACKCV